MIDRRGFLMSGSAAALGSALLGGEASAEAVNSASLAALRAIGLDPDRSEVMKTASYMMDVLGPRLSGSPGFKKAANWAANWLKQHGMSNTAFEPWPEDPTGNNNGFPKGWANEKFYLHATSPNPFPVNGMALGWTPSTRGLVSGECIMATDTNIDDLRRKFAGRLRGRWVLSQAPIETRAQWDPVARRLSQADLDALEVPLSGGPVSAPTAPQPLPNYQKMQERVAFFAQEGALGLLQTNKGHGAFNANGAPRFEKPENMLPRIAVEAEHYGRIARAVMQGQPVILEGDIRNAWYDKPQMFNVVAEIPGSEQPDEVVIIGGHFDSFHAATGATDNGGACACLMEAMRLLKTTNAPLKRTVRICLWDGEEQGLIGSRLYVASHFGGVRGTVDPVTGAGAVVAIQPEHGRLQAYFNLDNGVGAIRGVHNQGNTAIDPIFREWMEPLRDLGVTHVSQRSSRSTDHASFDDAGLPGFQFIQDPLDYEPNTHHTNMDFFEALQPEDMRRNSVILATFAMMAANHSGLLPRKTR